MYCKFCQINIKGTPCQTDSAANNCANNRGREPDYDDDDYRIMQFYSPEFNKHKAAIVIPIIEVKINGKNLSC